VIAWRRIFEENRSMIGIWSEFAERLSPDFVQFIEEGILGDQ
jgi:hypothetical protein